MFNLKFGIKKMEENTICEEYDFNVLFASFTVLLIIFYLKNRSD